MRVVIFLLLAMPAIYLGYRVYYTDIIDPIKYIYSISGISAIVMLYITTSLSMIRGFHLVQYRRMVGLFSLFYALIHFANFVALDMQMDIEFMLEEISSKRFIYLGAVALIMLLFMGFTSTKALFRKYGRYHKVVYFAIILSTIHYIMGQKSLDIYEWGYLSIGAIITISKLIQLKNKYNK